MNILLETDYLILREWKDIDYESLVSITDQPYVYSWIPDWQGWSGWGHDWIKEVNTHYQIDNPMTNFMSWAIVLKETNKIIGQINIGDFEDKEISIGYFIDENFSNHGYTTQAASALIQHAFKKYHYDHIITIAQPANLASNAVIKKLGFQLISVIKSLQDGQTQALPFNYYRINNPSIKE